MSKKKPKRKKRIGDYWPPMSFTERMDLGKELTAMRKRYRRPRGKLAPKPTAAEERAMYDEQMQKYLGDSPCRDGARPASGGCTRSGCCSWHKGVKPLTAPF